MSAFFEKVDKQFYAKVSADNGGKLPDDLKGPDGAPRRLDPDNPMDAGYISVYKDLMAAGAPSTATPNVAVTQPACMLCGGSPSSPPIDPTSPCRHQSLTVRCDHKGRQVSIDEMLQAVELQVVAGPDKNADKISCETTTLEGPCPVHTNNILDVTPQVPPGSVSPSSSTKLEFDARSTPISGGNFFKFFWPTGHTLLRHYKVSAVSCNGEPLEVAVVAFPDISWNVGLTASFDSNLLWSHEHDKESNTLFYNKRGGDQIFKLTPTVSWKYDGKTHKLSPSVQKKLKRAVSVLNWVGEKIEYFVPIFAELTGTKFTIKSKVTIEGKWDWQELDGPYCGFGGQVKLSLDPLMELKVKQDITKFILNGIAVACPPAAPATRAIITWIEQNKAAKKGYKKMDQGGYVLGEIAITGYGAVGADITWKKEHAATEWSATDASGNAKIGIKIESTLEAKGKLKIWKFGVSAEATIGVSAASEVSLYNVKGSSKNGDIHLGCVLHWNGITIRGVFSGGLGGTIAAKEKDDDDDKSTPELGGDYEQSTKEGGTKSSTKVSLGKDGAAIEKKVTKENKVVGPDGQEFTNTKTEGSYGGSIGKDGLKGEGGVSFEWTPEVFRPRTWNFTDELDPKSKSPPQGTFCIFRA